MNTNRAASCAAPAEPRSGADRLQLRCDDSFGSWPCENAGVLRRRRMAFSNSDVLSFSREAHLFAPSDAEAQKSRKLRGSYFSGARDSRLARVLLCPSRGCFGGVLE